MVHTNIFHRFFGHVSAEKRLLSLNKQGREDILVNAEKTGGTMNQKNSNDPLESLRLNTEELGQKIQNLAPSWLQNLVHLGQARKDLIEAHIIDEAKHRIREQTDLTNVRLSSIFRHGERQMLLYKTATQISNDLQQYLRVEQSRLETERQRYARILTFLKQKNRPILLKELIDTGAVLSAVNEVGAKYKRLAEAKESKGKGLPEEWKSARDTELMLREQLIANDIVSAEDIDRLLRTNANGGGDLEYIIKHSPVLQSKREMRAVFLGAIKKLRSRSVRGYKLLAASEKDPDIGSLADRLKTLEREAYPSRMISFSLDGHVITAAVISHKEKVLLLRDIARAGTTASGTVSSEYLVFDLENGIVTRRDPRNHKPKDYDMHTAQHSFTLRR